MEGASNMFESISDMLEEAFKYNLLEEVVLYSLLAMKNNPDLTAFEAVEIGYNEWIK